MSLCRSRQSWKAIHEWGCLPVVTWPITPAYKSHSCISWHTRSHWDCGSLDRRFLRSLYVLATALSWAFWASWSISWVWVISTLQDSWSCLEVAPLGPVDFWRFSRVPASLSTALASFLHCTLSPFWFMRCKTSGLVHANVGQNVTPIYLIVRQSAYLKVMLWYFSTYNNWGCITQLKHTTNITTIVMEPLAPPAVWIQWIHAAWVAGTLAHVLSKVAVKGFC